MFLVYLNQNLYLGQKLTISLNMVLFYPVLIQRIPFSKVLLGSMNPVVVVFFFCFFFFMLEKSKKMFCTNTGTWTIRP